MSSSGSFAVMSYYILALVASMRLSNARLGSPCSCFSTRPLNSPR
jgi:hypothetical protein